MLLDLWPGTTKEHPYVVFTGGEPLLQLDVTLITALHAANLEIAIETNGTIEAPAGIDWICVSPKANAEVVQKRGNELKFVYPQKEVAPEEFINLDFDYFFIQPMDGPDLNQNIKLAIDFCLRNPQWRLSLQTHKFSGMK
jgi:7-carboxy-7-deazaguanine synthase (Cx14CxxC type)